MSEYRFKAEDIRQIEDHGLDLETVENQLSRFVKGVSQPRLVAPCTLGKGVVALSEAGVSRLATSFQQAVDQKRVTKFIPASGAATRMFKFLLSAFNRGTDLTRASIAAQAEQNDSEAEKVLQFWDRLSDFAFSEALERVMADNGVDLEQARADGDIGSVLTWLLTSQGLGYADLPKGLIPFHRYADQAAVRVYTAFEEHLAESREFFSDPQGACRLHFTVAPDYRRRITEHIAQSRVCGDMSPAQAGVETDFSIQKTSTDTIAATAGNEPFRDTDGRLVFRPGGHGALLENLNDLEGDIVFIKNVDNVAHEKMRRETGVFLQALGGQLLVLQKEVFACLQKIAADTLTRADIAHGLDLVRQRFNRGLPQGIEQSDYKSQKAFLFDALNRPVRVCGVVPQTGEPGGGPFWVEDETGQLSVQIIESAQVDFNDPQQKEVWSSSTHFNPVIIVGGLRDFQGNAFHLPDFADPAAAFITEKSANGQTLKALEYPGLWNGGMAFWNTAFVELPAEVFNPVKTVLDLLRPAHQA